MDKRTLWAAALFLFVVGDGVATQVRGALLPNSKGSFAVSDSLLGPVAPAGSLVLEDQTIPEGHLAYGAPAETKPLTEAQRAEIDRVHELYVEQGQRCKNEGDFE